MIKQRGSSWWVVVYAGRDPLTGKKVQKTGTAPTKKAAKQLEAKLIREAGRTLGNNKASGSHTVGELLDAWHEWRPRKGGISERQLMNYRSIIDNKVAPALGKTKLSAVDTTVIDRLLSQLSLRGKKCQHCHHLIRTGAQPLRDGVMYRPRPGLRERAQGRLRRRPAALGQRRARRLRRAVERLPARAGLGLGGLQPVELATNDHREQQAQGVSDDAAFAADNFLPASMPFDQVGHVGRCFDALGVDDGGRWFGAPA